MTSYEVEVAFSSEGWEQEEGCEEGEVCGGPHGDGAHSMATLMDKEQSDGGGGDSEGDEPWSSMVPENEGDACDGDDCGEERKVAQGELGGGVDWMFAGLVGIVLPGIDKEAVETAEGCEEKRGGKKRKAEAGLSGDGGDKGGGGEADTDG